MPTKKDQALPGVREMLHLLRGCCLTHCSLCYGPAGIAGPNLAWRLRPHAAQVWRRHRSELLAIWRTKPEGPRQAGFRAAVFRGFGAWFPCFAEIVFDGVPLPPPDKAWPEETRGAYASLSTYLGAR